MSTQPTKPIDDAPKVWPHEHVYRCQDCGEIQDVSELIIAYRQQLLDRIEKEIIGEDEYPKHRTGAPETIGDERMAYRNVTRTNQRTALAKLRKEYLGDE